MDHEQQGMLLRRRQDGKRLAAQRLPRRALTICVRGRAPSTQLIYLPAKPTESFKSFSAPILNIRDSHIVSQMFGPNKWVAMVLPVAGGGIPTHFSAVDLKLTFWDGGWDAFRQRFEVMRERHEQIRQLRSASGGHVNYARYAHDEQLPRYEAASGAPPSAAQGEAIPPTQRQAPTGTAAPPGAATPSTRTPTGSRQPGEVPNEPPPDYEEAQAQAVGMGVDAQLREEAEREGR